MVRMPASAASCATAWVEARGADQLAHRLAHLQELEDADPADEAHAFAGLAARGLVQLADPLGSSRPAWVKNAISSAVAGRGALQAGQRMPTRRWPMTPRSTEASR